MFCPCPRVVLSLICVSAVTGCGAATYDAGSPASDAGWTVSEESPPANVPTGDLNLVTYQPPAPADAVQAPDAAQTPPTTKVATTQVARRVIHNATLDIVVEQFNDVPARIEELASKNGGFISKANVDTATGRSRHGTWTIRVPVERYRALMTAAGSIGVLQRGVEDSREVTAEYYDLDSRLRNKEREEARLLEHLDETSRDLQQVLTLEKELARVRQESEQIAGQLRVLKDVTALSTVTINVSEIEEFVAEAPPTFVARIQQTWSNSFGGLTSLGQIAVLVAVALAPWLGAMAVPLLLVVVLYRRQQRPGAAT